MKAITIKKTLFKASVLASVIGALLPSQLALAATVTAEAIITASGTEIAPVAQPYNAPLAGIARFDTGCNAFCSGPQTKSTNETHGIPAQYSHCDIDTSRGNKLPGLSVYVSSANSHGRAMTENYSLDLATKTMRAQVSVSSQRRMGAWYTASYEIHVKCPQTVSWTNTQTKTITIDSKNGYSHVGSYTGPIGTIGHSAVVNNDLFKVELKNIIPANATITADMLLSSPGSTKGPNLFALYEPDNLPATGVKILQSATDSNEGGGMSIGDINNNGIDDIIFATYQDAGMGQDNEYKYKIGWDIDTEGNPKAWSDVKTLNGTGWQGSGASVALFKPTTAGEPTRAVFVNMDIAPDLRIKYGTINSNGDFSEWSNLGTPSFGSLAYGVGVELYNLDSDPSPEIILSGNSSYHKYKIGWNLQPNGSVSRWTEHTGNSYSNTAVAVAVANLDRNPRPEIVMTYRNSSDNRVYRAIGWNLDQNGVPRQWEAARPLPMTLPATANRIDVALMDLDVFGQTSQRGSGHREKAIVIAGLDSSSTPDNFHYSFIRHSNAKDGVFNGNFTSTAKWHRWGGQSTYDATQTALCGSNINTLNPWDSGIYSQEPISLETGKRYALTFDAWVATNATVGAKIGSATVNSAVYKENLAIALKPGWNRYQMEPFTSPVTNPDTRAEFFFGGSTAASKICIDNVRFAPVLDTTNDFASFPASPATALIKNGTFSYGSMAGWEIKSEAAGATQAATKIKNGELCHYTPGATNPVKESLGQNNIALEAGAKYQLQFDIRGSYLPPSTNSPSVELKVGADGPSFDEYLFNSAVPVSNVKTTKTFEFTMGASADSAAGFAIFTGNTHASEICIDNVSLIKKP